ncbi:MAG: GNAT family N-acetyltransferase [Candidatus Promineifilaceae bacterium]|nr:GNAT family N-acetyltransferase [Candidatus Promineifilaceae bacterium]
MRLSLSGGPGPDRRSFCLSQTITSRRLPIAPWTIRPASPSDAQRIRQIVRRAGIWPFDLNWSRFVVAEQAGAIISVGQVKEHGDGSRELASVATVPAHQGRGAASAVIRALLVGENGTLYLFCRTELAEFYRRFGFRIVGGEQLPPVLARRHWLAAVFGRLAALVGRSELGIIAMRRLETSQGGSVAGAISSDR